MSLLLTVESPSLASSSMENSSCSLSMILSMVSRTPGMGGPLVSFVELGTDWLVVVADSVSEAGFTSEEGADSGTFTGIMVIDTGVESILEKGWLEVLGLQHLCLGGADSDTFGTSVVVDTEVES